LGYDDPEVHWQKTIALAAPIADAFNSLPPEGQVDVRTAVSERVAERLGDDPKSLDGIALTVVAE
jgi:hypothetical protein